MKAVILCAGRGKRLGSINADMPKCMLTLGSKRLVDYQLESLRRVGITRACFVVGYNADAVKRYLNNKDGFEITFIENPSFADTNTAYSLFLAGNEMNEDTVFLNGDVLFHDEVLRRVCFSDKPISLAVERKKCGEEEVKVTLDGSRVTGLSKDIEPSKAFGEFVGIGKCSDASADLFRDSLRKVVDAEGGRLQYFEAAISAMLTSLKVTAVDITDLSCVEIDFPEDFLKAQYIVLPAIAPESGVSKPRILFYVMRNLHLPFLEPIHDYIADNYPVECAFSAPPYLRPQKGMTGCGLPPETVNRLKHKSMFYEKTQDYEADIAVVADACYYPVRHCKQIVNVGHGMISKGLFFTDSPMVRRENLADLICVPGSWHKDILEKNVFTPISVTGFIKTDQLASCGPSRCSTFRQKYGIDHYKKYILFAPTFNQELSAIPCVRERIAELGDEDTCVIIKLHGMTDDQWVSLYHDLAQSVIHVCVIEDEDCAEAMLCADVMISDVSSIFIEFMLLDKPVVLFNNPRLTEYPQFDESNIEYRVRDAAIQVSTMEELLLAVRLSFADPTEYSDKRKRYAEELNTAIDGKCTQRAAQEVIGMLSGAASEGARQPLFSIILASESRLSDEELCDSVAEIQRTAEPCNYEIIVSQPDGSAAKSSCNGISLFVQESQTGSTSRLENACNQASGDYIVVLRPNLKLPRKFLRLMQNYFRWHPDAGAVKALSYRDNYQDLLQHVPQKERPKSYKQTAEYLTHIMIGNDIPAADINGCCECVMFPAPLYMQYTTPHNASGTGDTIAAMSRTLAENGYGLWHVVEAFVYPIEASSHLNEAKQLLSQARDRKQNNEYNDAIAMLEKAKALCSGSGTQESPDAEQLLEKALTMKENRQYSEAAAVLEEAKTALSASMN